MKYDTMRTFSDCSQITKVGYFAKEHAKEDIKNTAKQIARQAENTAEGNSLDRDTSKVVHTATMAATPVVSVVAGNMLQLEYRHALENFAKTYENPDQIAKLTSIMAQQQVFFKQIKPDKDGFFDNDGLITQRVNLNKINKNNHIIDLNDTSKVGSYSMKNGYITVYNHHNIKQLMDASKLTLSRNKRKFAGKLSKDDKRYMRLFYLKNQRLNRLQKSSRLLTNPKHIGRQITKIATAPIENTETMQGARLAKTCAIPIRVGYKFTNKQLNKFAYTICRKRLERQYIKTNGEQVAKADAKRFAKESMQKMYNSPMNFFKEYKQRKIVEVLTRKTESAKTVFGKTMHQTLKMNTDLAGRASTETIKRAGREAMKASLKSTKIGSKVANSKVGKFVQKFNPFSIRRKIKQKIRENLFRFTKAFIRAVISFIGIASVAMILMLPVLLIAFNLGDDEDVVAGQYVTNEEWVNVCDTVKQAIAEQCKLTGYNETNAYYDYQRGDDSATKDVIIQVNGQNYTVRRDCSGYVDACLQIMGVPEVTQNWDSRAYVYNTNINGFTKYTMSDIGGPSGLMIGDIMAKNGHVQIYAGKSEDGVDLVWSNGNDIDVLNTTRIRTGGTTFSQYTVVWRPNSSE